VQDVFRVIDRRSDALLVVDVEVHSETTQIAGLQTKVAELTAKNAELTGKNERLSKEVSEHGTALSNLERQNEELHTALESFERILQSNLAQLESKDAEIAQMTDQLAAVNAKRAGGFVDDHRKKEEDARQAAIEIARLREENELLRAQNASLQAPDAIDQLSRENASLKEQLSRAQAELLELRDVSMSYDSLKAEISAICDQGHSSDEIANLKRENAQLTQDLEALVESMDNAKRRPKRRGCKRRMKFKN
jgi:chromosome segregation ATPase